MTRPVKVAPWVRLVREPGKYPSGETIMRVRSPESVVSLIGDKLRAEEVEVFVLVALSAQSTVLGIVEVTRGIVNSTLVHPREVFRPAIALGASGVIVAHNHPSGDCTPSSDDRAISRQLVAAGELLDIPVYDCLVVGGPGRFTSFASQGLL